MGDCKNKSLNNLKTCIGASPDTSYRERIIGGLLERCSKFVGGGFGSSVFVFVGFAFGHFCVAGAAVCGDWARGGEGLLQFDGSDG